MRTTAPVATNRGAARTIAGREDIPVTDPVGVGRRQLLEMLGLVDETGHGVAPDPPAMRNASGALVQPQGAPWDNRTQLPTSLVQRRARSTVPAGLAAAAHAPVAEPKPGAARGFRPERQDEKRPPVTRPECGSLTGRNHHAQHGERLCDRCRIYYNSYQRALQARIAQPRKPKGPIPKCGEKSGARRHRRLGEPVDDACKRAEARYKREWYAEKLAKQGKVVGKGNAGRRPECGSATGARAHKRRGEPVCEACRLAKNARQREIQAKPAEVAARKARDERRRARQRAERQAARTAAVTS